MIGCIIGWELPVIVSGSSREAGTSSNHMMPEEILEAKQPRQTESNPCRWDKEREE